MSGDDLPVAHDEELWEALDTLVKFIKRHPKQAHHWAVQDEDIVILVCRDEVARSLQKDLVATPGVRAEHKLTKRDDWSGWDG